MRMAEKILDNIRYKNLECYNAQKTIENIIRFLNGEKLYFYNKWSKTCGRFKLLKHGFTESVRDIMSKSGIKFELGNDAPKGGAVGSFIQITRTNKRITNDFIMLIENKLNRKIDSVGDNENKNFKINLDK